MGEDADTALNRLHAAAAKIRLGWRPPSWTRVSGPGPETLEMRPAHIAHPYWAFEDIVLEPGEDLTLSCPLDLPEQVGGVPLAGDRLDVMLFSLFPTALSVDGREVFGDDLPVVASGPALTTLVPSIRPGVNGTVELTVRPPDNQLVQSWVLTHYSTPGTRARFEALDTAWAQLRLAQALAASPDDDKAVELAAQLVPDDLLGQEPAMLSASLAEMTEALSPLHARARELDVHLIGHSHIDLAWLWRWSDTVEVIKRDVRSVLDMLDDYPEMCFTHSQPAGYEVIRTEEPEQFERIRQHVAAGRWEPATMQWVESDTNMVSGEATARQLLEGVHYTHEHLGVRPSVLLAPDTFGHAGTLPQLAASAGARIYYNHRSNPGRYREPADMWPAYWWEGVDGSRLLSVSTPIYNGHITAEDLVEAALSARQHGHQSALCFYGVGDHGGGPTRQSLDVLRRFQDQPMLPQARCSTISAYVHDLEESKAPLPTHVGESATMFEGCYTTHADTKRYNRMAENLLATAETLGVLAGQDRSEDFRQAWRTVCFNQFHDIIAGSSIREVYADHAADFERVSEIGERAIEDALGVLEADAAPGGIVVTNPLAWDREDVVVLPALTPERPVRLIGSHGHETWGQPSADGLCFVPQVPAFSTVEYTVRQDDVEPPRTMADGAAADISGTPSLLCIETPTFRAQVRRDSGIIVGLVDKRVGRELVAYGLRRHGDVPSARPDLALNVLQLVDENPHGMTSWNFDEVRGEESLLQGATTEVVESGPVRVVVEVRHQVRSSSVSQRITFYRDLPRIDIHVSVDWQEPGDREVGVPNLKLAFTPNLDPIEAWFEVPFGAVRRPANGQEVPALRWASVGNDEYGFTVLNGSTYGHDALGCRLRVHLVRTAFDPDTASDLGEHEFAFSVVPHPGDWRDADIPRRAAGFNQPLLARLAAERQPLARRPRPWRPVMSADSTVILSGLKRSHDGAGTVIRLYESAGRPATPSMSGLPSVAAVWETNIVEDRIRHLDASSGTLALNMRPWEVRTLLVEDE